MTSPRIRPLHCLALATGALVALVGAGAAGAVAGPWAEAKEAKVRLLSRFAAAPAGGDAGLGVEFQLAPGWHVYWKNAGDAGYPPAIEFEGAALDALITPRLLYPAPSRFALPGGLVAFGYEREIVYPIDARLAPAASKRVPIAAQVDYLVCAETCIPYTVHLALDLPVAGAADAGSEPALDPESAPLVDGARDRLPEPAPEDTRARLLPGDGEALTLELILGLSGARAVAPDLFFETHDLLDLGRPEPLLSASSPGFRVALRPLDETKPLPDRLRFSWTVTGFEQDGRPCAWEGVTELERPSAVASSGFGRVALFAALAGAALWFILRRGGAPRAHPRQP